MEFTYILRKISKTWKGSQIFLKISRETNEVSILLKFFNYPQEFQRFFYEENDDTEKCLSSIITGSDLYRLKPVENRE